MPEFRGAMYHLAHLHPAVWDYAKEESGQARRDGENR